MITPKLQGYRMSLRRTGADSAQLLRKARTLAGGRLACLPFDGRRAMSMQ